MAPVDPFARDLAALFPPRLLGATEPAAGLAPALVLAPALLLLVLALVRPGLLLVVLLRVELLVLPFVAVGPALRALLLAPVLLAPVLPVPVLPVTADLGAVFPVAVDLAALVPPAALLGTARLAAFFGTTLRGAGGGGDVVGFAADDDVGVGGVA